jgi:hypothetical protein
VTFGTWRALPTATAPRKPGLLQARVAELLEYPRGKSAMVYYDGDEDVAQAFARLCARVPPGADVRVRFGECRDPEVQLLRKLDEFKRRFGALPAWNDSTVTSS